MSENGFLDFDASTNCFNAPKCAAAVYRRTSGDWHEEMELSTIVEIRATDPLMSAVCALRHEVFVVEQGVPEELEIDEDDKVATHLAALSDGHVIGTLRIVQHERTAKVGRMAVSASSRKKGIGRELMEFAAATASHGGADEIILGAQLIAREFYKRLGYVEEGVVFDDAGIPHVTMRKKLVRNKA